MILTLGDIRTRKTKEARERQGEARERQGRGKGEARERQGRGTVHTLQMPTPNRVSFLYISSHQALHHAAFLVCVDIRTRKIKEARERHRASLAADDQAQAGLSCDTVCMMM